MEMHLFHGEDESEATRGISMAMNVSDEVGSSWECYSMDGR